jgi:quercetin dioxygenase-like cupin family protein
MKFWIGMLAVSLSGAAAQNLPQPGTPSPNLAAAKVFDPASLPLGHNPNGSERRDVVTGRLATGEAIHIHESLQPPGLAPNPAHAIAHSEFILVQDGTLEFTHDGKTETAGPGSVIYVAYGTLHQARNAGTVPARYTVIAIGGDAQ